MRRSLLLQLRQLLPLLLCTAPFALAAGTPGAESPERPPEGAAAQSEAEARYRAGLERKAEAWTHESAAAAESDPEERARLEALALAAYRSAADAQGAALKLDPLYAEAANELGYALRKSGDHRKAVGAYNYAIGLKPDFLEAIEYRGEALLGIGDLEGAKLAYMRLFRDGPELAGTLLLAMQTWLDARADDTEEIDAFAAWVAERRELASVGLLLNQNAARRW